MTLIRNLLKRMPGVDYEMIPAKLTFFITDGYFGSIAPFMNVYYVSLGLTTTHAGLISGVSLLVSSIFNPLWTTLSDATGYRKLIFVIMCLGTAISVFSMPWVELAVGKHISTNTSTNLTVSNSHVEENKLLNIETVFYTLLALNIVAWIFFTSVRCYVDGLVMKVVKSGTKERNYGNQRLFQSLGYAAISFLTGIIADHYTPTGMSHYTAIFYVFLPFIILLMPIGCKVINQVKWDELDETEKEGKNREEKGTSVVTQLLSAFKNLDFVVFFLSIVVQGLVLNVFNCFFFMLMEHELKSSKTIMTFALVVSVVAEITVFALSDKIIKLCGGTIPAFTIGMFSFFPRFMIMSYAQSPWVAVAVQPLHSLGFGLSWAAVIDHTYVAFPVEIRVTAIALMSSIEFIASNAVANMAGGILYDLFGGRVLFRAAGIIAAVWCLFITLFYGIRYHLRKRNTDEESNRPPSYPQGISQTIDLELPSKENV